MTSELAAGRKELAAHLAFETGMEAAAAIAVLSRAPKGAPAATAAAKGSHFDAAIASGRLGAMLKETAPDKVENQTAFLLASAKAAGFIWVS